MSYRIVTDTSANLPTPLVRQEQIQVIPLSYHIDGQEYTCLDTEKFDPQTYYDRMKRGEKITTSQINPQKYTEYTEPILKAGEDILFIGMSSGISGSLASGAIAREQLLEDYPDRTIRIVDSLGASMGEGLLVLRAIECRKQGMSLDETADLLIKEREKVCQIFTVDDLHHLRRGGRLSNAAAIVGTLLHIKPVLKGNEAGQIVSVEKHRGRKAVIARLAERYAQLAVAPKDHVTAISHCACPEDAEKMAQLLRENGAGEILIVPHEPVTGSYLGPGALALYFIGDENVRLA